MSLFQTHETWFTANANSEVCSSGCLAVGHIGEEVSGDKKIVTASLLGVLRVYVPTIKEYEVDDLILEVDLHLPVMQIEIGMFLPEVYEGAVAVLHPRKLVIYKYVASGTFHELVVVFEHNMEHPGIFVELLFTLPLVTAPSNCLLCELCFSYDPDFRRKHVIW